MRRRAKGWLGSWWRVLGGLLALGLAAPDAGAATCRLQGQGQWGPIQTYTGPDDCGGVLSPGDRFIVEGDVEVVADLVQAAVPATGIDVAAGGSLHVGVGPGPRRIVVGTLGLNCLSGSQCDLEGAFRTPRSVPGASAGGLVAAISSESSWSFGAPVPCPGWDSSQGIWQPDCAGTLQGPGDLPGSDTVLGGHYAGPPDPELTVSLDAVEAGEVWYFSDPDPGDADALPESGFHYEIVAAQGQDAPGGPTGHYVHLDVRQGLADNGYPLGRRRVLACEIAEPVAAHGRELFTGAGCIGRDYERDGHWIRFERNGVAFADCPGTAAAPCEAEGRTWRIQASHNDVACPGGGTCDRFTIADLRGFQSGRDAGGVAWINQVGAGEGDAGAVMVPVRIASATPAVNEAGEGDSEAQFDGEYWIRKVVFDRTGQIRAGATGAVFGAFDDVFLSAPSSDGQNPLYFFGPAESMTIRRVTLVGGEQFQLTGSGGGGNDHGIGFLDPAGTLDVVLEDVSVRYAWDDMIVTSGSQPPASLTVHRARVQFEGESEESQAGLDVQSAATYAVIEDFECVDCADSNRPISVAAGTTGAVRRVLFLAPKSDLSIRLVGPVEDVTAIGARDAQGTQLAEGNLHRCVLRDNVSISAGSAMISGSDDTDVSQCVFQGNGVALDFIFGGFGGLALWIRDSVFLDNTDVNAAGNGDDVIDCRSISGPDGSCRIERTTVAYSTARQGHPANFRTGIRATAGTDGREVTLVENVLFGLGEGFRVTTPAEATLERLCFEQNVSNAPAAQYAQVVDPVSGPLDLRDPDQGAFDPLPDGVADLHPCGIRLGAAAPGVCQRSWAHAVSGLEPECMAPACSNGADDDFDGLRDHPEDPSCASPEADDEGAPPACGDGLDNDGDGLVDLADPGCPHAGLGPEDPACDDGIDNDGDLLVDFADPGCKPSWPYQEQNQIAACGLGAEAAGLLAVLLALRRRRRGASKA